MNISIILFFVVILFYSCNANNQQIKASTAEKISLSLFPVTAFLKGQLNEVEKTPITPLKTTIINGIIDSIWIARDSIRTFASPFLTPLIDSASLNPFFNGESFLDQTINSVTLSYTANEKLPQHISLKAIDVYVEPQQNTITKVYLLKEVNTDSIKTTSQLTWTTNRSCSIVTIRQKRDDIQEIKEEKITWAFN